MPTSRRSPSTRRSDDPLGGMARLRITPRRDSPRDLIDHPSRPAPTGNLPGQDLSGFVWLSAATIQGRPRNKRPTMLAANAMPMMISSIPNSSSGTTTNTTRTTTTTITSRPSRLSTPPKSDGSQRPPSRQRRTGLRRRSSPRPRQTRPVRQVAPEGEATRREPTGSRTPHTITTHPRDACARSPGARRSR
jgi:hypothetical protein